VLVFGVIRNPASLFLEREALRSLFIAHHPRRQPDPRLSAKAESAMRIEHWFT
jgi:hypothetical protein